MPSRIIRLRAPISPRSRLLSAWANTVRQNSGVRGGRSRVNPRSWCRLSRGRLGAVRFGVKGGRLHWRKDGGLAMVNIAVVL